MTRSWDGSVYSGSTNPTHRGNPYLFSQTEVRDILIAWAALALAFTIAYSGGVLGGGDLNFGYLYLYVIAFVAVGSGFVLHELMHKFTAERYGYWAEFRMWTMGIILALITSTLGFIFAAPGATYIQGYNVNPRQNGIISLAGPATNVVIALVFLLVRGVGNTFISDIGQIGAPVNLFLATFNLLPIMPLDGAKVFRWNKAIWGGCFIPLALVLLFALNVL